MKRIFKFRPVSIALFWKYFASYFFLFIIPVILASVLTYVYVVKLMENEAEEANNIIMRNFSDKTDTVFSSLQLNMINLLNNSNLNRAVRQFEEPERDLPYYEITHSLMEQLNTFNSRDIASNAYYYFPKHDLIIGYNMEMDKEAFFQSAYRVGESDLKGYLDTFTGKKMMHFTKPYRVDYKTIYSDAAVSASSHISAVMSYPYNNPEPDVYLVVTMDREEISKQIRIHEEWVIGTAIVDHAGNFISETGKATSQPQETFIPFHSVTEGELYVEISGKAVSFVRSGFNPSWYYVSMVDMETMLEPANRIRYFSLLFLTFFIILGGILSYYLSKKLYKPIKEIKDGLSAHHATILPVQRSGNAYDYIKQASTSLISKNKELSDRVSSMIPIVQEDFISKILLGEYSDNLSIELYAKEIDFDFDSKLTRTVICIHIQYYARVVEDISETSKSFMQLEVREHIQKSIPGMVWICQTRTDVLACILHKDTFLRMDIHEVTRCLEQILQQFGSYYKATIGVGKKVHEIGELHLSYNTAIAMLQHKGLNAGVEVFHEDSVWEDKTSIDGFLSNDEVNRIINLYKIRNYAVLLQSVHELLDTALRKNATAYLVKSLCSDVLNSWIRAVETERNDFSISFYSGLFDQLNRCVTWEELKQTFEHIHSMLFQMKQPDDLRDQLADILDYIHTHFDEELSVERFASELNMSESHFSRTFKEAVGEKYVEYISKYRLSMAKKYLLETEMKIDDIAEKVGYMGRNSLIRLFRKYEGVTPGQYRSMHQS
ncbi:helix-turn-helix domain-containing protein [Paenibacillus puerhi]|uniref:helix-turn-helix domain-containing protein n=1 Tax=Paenibacillus puerhi TaxID=2692622 RepID=UPI00135C98AF|nr:helix-turn-helix domain-containing protein [Paenibacillus puerhi]